MKQLVFAILALVIAIGAFYYTIALQKQNQLTPLGKLTPEDTNTRTMSIASSAFENNGIIPDVYTCSGKSINPPLTFKDISHNAKSIALIVDDPDAPMGTFVHWVVFNMSPDTKAIAENSVPLQGIQGLNGAKQNSFAGPCPPSGSHHYLFKLYALDTVLDGDIHADKKLIEDKMKGHIISQAQLVGFYSKK